MDCPGGASASGWPIGFKGLSCKCGPLSAAGRLKESARGLPNCHYTLSVDSSFRDIQRYLTNISKRCRFPLVILRIKKRVSSASPLMALERGACAPSAEWSPDVNPQDNEGLISCPFSKNIQGKQTTYCPKSGDLGIGDDHEEKTRI